VDYRWNVMIVNNIFHKFLFRILDFTTLRQVQKGFIKVHLTLRGLDKLYEKEI
jgi:hypothetical protein